MNSIQRHWLKTGLNRGCVRRGRCPSDTPLAALPANSGAAEGSVARSRVLRPFSSDSSRAVERSARILGILSSRMRIHELRTRFSRALAEVVVCAVGWDVTLPVMEMTAQATPLPVLVTLFPSWSSLRNPYLLRK